MPGPALLALLGVLVVLVLIPTRRLYLAGWSPPMLATYFFVVLGMALLLAEIRGPARFLVPILVVAYLAPFVTARAGIDRLLGRGRSSGGPTAGAADDEGGDRDEEPRPPPRNVTPPDQPED